MQIYIRFVKNWLTYTVSFKKKNWALSMCILRKALYTFTLPKVKWRLKAKLMCNTDMHITEENRSVNIKTACEDAIIIFRCVGVHVSVFFCYKDKTWVFLARFAKCIWDKERFILIFTERFYQWVIIVYKQIQHQRNV